MVKHVGLCCDGLKLFLPVGVRVHTDYSSRFLFFSACSDYSGEVCLIGSSAGCWRSSDLCFTSKFSRSEAVLAFFEPSDVDRTFRKEEDQTLNQQEVQTLRQEAENQTLRQNEDQDHDVFQSPVVLSGQSSESVTHWPVSFCPAHSIFYNHLLLGFFLDCLFHCLFVLPHTPGRHENMTDY